MSVSLLDGAVVGSEGVAVPADGYLLVGRDTGAQWLLGHLAVGSDVKMEAANRLRMPIIIHVRADASYGREHAQIVLDRLVAAAPRVPITIAHLWGGELLSEEVGWANQDLPESVRVRRFALLHKQFDADDDEITRTRKVRRRVINERYAAIIDALADGAAEVEIKSLVTYQDGSNVTRNITLPIVSMDGFTSKQAGGRRSLFGSHA